MEESILVSGGYSDYGRMGMSEFLSVQAGLTSIFRSRSILNGHELPDGSGHIELLDSLPHHGPAGFLERYGEHEDL